MKIRAHVLIKGLVQGVGFRNFVRRSALKLNLSGWVRNIKDGVEAVFEGEKEDVEKMILICREGSPFSKVESVDVLLNEYKGEFKGFEIRL
jgi:acylphosphatase